MERRLLRLLEKAVLSWQQAGWMLSGQELAVLLQRVLGRALERHEAPHGAPNLPQ